VTVIATPHPLFWVAGTVTRMGQRFRDSENTTFHSLEICRLGGKVQRFPIVRAIEHIAALVERDCIGTFFFWSQPGERRLWCVARADGPHGIDLTTMHKIIPEAHLDSAGAVDAS
jgi:hypothetical protein